MAEIEDTKKVLEYFADKANFYDDVESQHYWRLSDELLWYVLKETVLEKLPNNFKFLDAGGGTGRWTFKILENYPRAEGTLFDLSPDMLAQAKQKINPTNKSKIKIINGNLECAKELNDNTFDLVFNFHNVLGFVNSVKRSFKELVRIAKPGGSIVSFVPNKYHAFFFNIFTNNVAMANELESTNRGRFTSSMPSMHFFTPETIKNIYEKNGLSVALLTGFPNIIYPGIQETKISGSSEKIAELLADPKNFEFILRLEKKLIFEKNIAARGNNLYVCGIKKS
jgi:ubiquinone/menaquinone biosynthesis C-methylase UbiE